LRRCFCRALKCKRLTTKDDSNLSATNLVAVIPAPTVITPITITPGSTTITGSGTSATLKFSFINAPGLTFSVLATNNVAAPLTNWPAIGTVTNYPPGSGHYQFTDPNPATNGQMFYNLSHP
jgi:hypothetical protein